MTTNPILQSAYPVEYVAECLSIDVSALKKKLAEYPECYPPYTFIGRTSRQDGVIVFPKRLFDQWIESNAVTSQISSSEADAFARHA